MSVYFTDINLYAQEPDIAEEGDIVIPHRRQLETSVISKSSIIDILIVDDVEFNLSVLKNKLEILSETCNCKNDHRKYTVHSAKSGKEAISLIHAQDHLKGGYNLIIMDCLMPEMDGWETSICIRNMYLQGRIRILPCIIAYSAFDSEEDVLKSEVSGMAAHLSKPCSQLDLCKALHHWIN